MLDPRVAFLVTSLMEDVINHGTGYPVRALGFTAPAAGKTGTSRDGWFAGYTSNLLCVVWVGFDDNRDLGITGGASAAPIWGEFMKRAVAQPGYRNTQDFEPPDGVVQETWILQTGQLSNASCPQAAQEYFITGSEPTQYCDGGHATGGAPGTWLSHLFGNGTTPSPAGNSATGTPAAQSQPNAAPGAKPRRLTNPEPTTRKKAFSAIFLVSLGVARNLRTTRNRFPEAPGCRVKARGLGAKEYSRP